MKRIFLVGGVAIISLIAVSCSTPWTTDATPAQQVYAAKRGYATSLDLAVAYVGQPECTATVVVACHDPDYAERIRAAAAEADRLLDLAEAAVRDPAATDDAVAASAALARAAVAELSRLILEVTTR